VSSVNQVGMSDIVSLTAAAIPKTNDPAKVHHAAQQFEALLIGQILHAAHGDGGGWLDSGSDSTGSCATDFAEEHLAATIAQQGGLGLAKLITRGLAQESSRREAR
jgi:Rod binding domain-containing protein